MVDPIKIQFRPGINRETTNYGNTGGWYDCTLPNAVKPDVIGAGSAFPFRVKFVQSDHLTTP